MKFKLGNKIRDKVTGVEGITTGYVTYMNGCIQWNIHPKADKEGKTTDANYYDEQQLEFIDDGIADVASNKKTGGANTKVRSIL